MARPVHHQVSSNIAATERLSLPQKVLIPGERAAPMHDGPIDVRSRFSRREGSHIINLQPHTRAIVAQTNTQTYNHTATKRRNGRCARQVRIRGSVPPANDAVRPSIASCRSQPQNRTDPLAVCATAAQDDRPHARHRARRAAGHRGPGPDRHDTHRHRAGRLPVRPHPARNLAALTAPRSRRCEGRGPGAWSGALVEGLVGAGEARVG